MGLLPENSLLPVTANNKMLAQALKARQQPRTQLTGQGLLDTAAIGLGPVPVIGDALGLAADASRFYNEPESRTPLNFGLAALGLIPFVPPLVSAGLGKFAQSQGKTLTAPSMSGPAKNQAGAIVYHGSPHKFDQFDSSKIGTGEGAQAYGHGLYFAESPGVAKTYADNLSPPADATFGGQPAYSLPWLKDNTPEELALRAVGSEKGVDAALALTKKLGAKDADYAKAATWLEQNKNMVGLNNKGSLYKVDLPDEAIAKMLDYDKPFNQQPPEVMDALNKAGIPEIWKNQIGHDISKNAPQADMVYRTVGDSLGGQAKASDFLRQHGIPGIKYLDGTSRTAPPPRIEKSRDGFKVFWGNDPKPVDTFKTMAEAENAAKQLDTRTRNYVVFPGNEGLLKILSRE